jgi:LPPG:FO 2-phospho-L-lactate transferase
MSDDPVRTRVLLADGEEVSFQEYFVHRRHGVAVRSVRFEGAALALPAPGVLDLLGAAEVVLIAPSNPIVSIAPILALDEIAAVLRARRESVVAISPIIAGKALKGPADRLLVELGGEASAPGVAAHLAEFAATLVIDEADRDLAGAVAAAGMAPVVTDTLMRSEEVAMSLTSVALRAGRL